VEITKEMFELWLADAERSIDDPFTVNKAYFEGRRDFFAFALKTFF
jgi:hypothetical protein